MASLASAAHRRPSCDPAQDLPSEECDALPPFLSLCATRSPHARSPRSTRPVLPSFKSLCCSSVALFPLPGPLQRAAQLTDLSSRSLRSPLSIIEKRGPRFRIPGRAFRPCPHVTLCCPSAHPFFMTSSCYALEPTDELEKERGVRQDKLLTLCPPTTSLSQEDSRKILTALRRSPPSEPYINLALRYQHSICLFLAPRPPCPSLKIPHRQVPRHPTSQPSPSPLLQTKEVHPAIAQRPRRRSSPPLYSSSSPISSLLNSTMTSITHV